MCQTVAPYSLISGSRRAIGSGFGSGRAMWPRPHQLGTLAAGAPRRARLGEGDGPAPDLVATLIGGAPAEADRLRVVDDHGVPLPLQSLRVELVDLVEECPLLLAQRLLGSLQRVVEQLGRVVELLFAEDHVPVRIEANVAHQRHDRVEDLGDTAAER